MLDQNDLKQIKGIFQETITEEVPHLIENAITEKVPALIENAITEKVPALVKAVLQKTLEEDLLPLINDSFSAMQKSMNERFDQSDHRIDLLVDKVVDHEERLVRIESTMMTKADYRHLLGVVEDIATDVKTVKEDYGLHDKDIRAIKLKLQMA